jgi:hypothetical protein
MTPEERDIIGRFIARVGGAQIGGTVPSTQTALPPIDPEADRFINDQFNANPQARYRITQMAFVQEAALAEAQNRIKRLEYDLQQAQQAVQQAQTQAPQSRGLFGGLFGGGQSAPAYQPQYAPPPPQASYPPGYQPGMFRSGGSGFLGSALTTAAGVAGGVLAADALTSMFSGGREMGGGWGGGGGFGGGWGGGGGEVVNETVVNNYGTQDGGAGADPWAGAGAAPDADAGWSGGGAADTGSGDWGGGDSGGGWDDSGGGGGGSDDGSF